MTVLREQGHDEYHDDVGNHSAPSAQVARDGKGLAVTDVKKCQHSQRPESVDEQQHYRQVLYLSAFCGFGRSGQRVVEAADG